MAHRHRCALDLDTANTADETTGNYRNHIIETLKASGQPTDEARIQNSKFDCIGGGDIVYRQYCSNGCGGTDSEDPDYCF